VRSPFSYSLALTKKEKIVVGVLGFLKKKDLNV
jgi:hypothetical protein